MQRQGNWEVRLMIAYGTRQTVLACDEAHVKAHARAALLGVRNQTAARLESESRLQTPPRWIALLMTANT